MYNKFINLMLDNISKMQLNIKVSAFKVEFISRYPGLTYSPSGCALACAFVDHYCTNELAVSNHLLNTDDLFEAAYKDFLNMCEENGKNKKLLELEKKGSEIGYADKVFISLVRMFNTISKYTNDFYGWTAEKIAHTVLECMQEYYTMYWNSGETAEEYFLDCLMTTI